MTIYGIDLLAEKNLWSIYKKCTSRLVISNFNLTFTATTFVLLLCDSSYFPEKYIARINLTRSLSELGLGFGSTILGFLIAGFTIFATLSKPQLFMRMYKTPHTQSGLTYLEVNFFAFVEVFVVYLYFLVVCLSIKLFGGPGGFVGSIVAFSKTHPFQGYNLSAEWLGNIGFVLLGTLALYSLLALKSFIFNIYHAVITAIVWEFNSK